MADRELANTSSLRPWWIALALWLTLVCGAVIVLWHLRADAIEGQSRELGLLSLALTDDVSLGLRGAEEGLLAMRAELRDGRLPASGPEASRALSTRADLMPLVQTLWLTDTQWQVYAASDATVLPPQASFAPALEGLPDERMAASLPFAGTGSSRSMVALAFRYREAPGTSGGWIVAALPASALLGAFASTVPSADASMAVFRADGAMLASANLPSERLEASLLQPPLAASTDIEERQFQDGSHHLVGLHGLTRYGIRVALSRDLDATLTAWRQAAELTASALALLLVFMALGVHFVLRAERRRTVAQQALQAQIARASKLESLGTMAGGVAHDFNNILAGIVGYGEMAHDAAVPGSPQSRHLDKVLQAALRGKSLVERILAFSRGGARASTVFELEPVVEEVLSLLSATVPPSVALERDLMAPGGRLRGDATQAFEAVMNLCTNALQAMPAGGMLHVRLERMSVTTPQVLSHSRLAAGDHLVLSVTDHGGGISPDVMEHLFEPFFTTRGAQSGSGLGLAVVHGVVAEFGGAIDVQSAPGRGARFTLYLPECKDVAVAPEAASHRALVGSGQRVLVVDDEPALVELTCELLRDLGYEPEGCGSSSEALKALRFSPRRFAAVLTDEVMPELSGTRLTELLRQFLPDMPVLLVSGYGGASLAKRALSAGVTRVLAKPLRRADLAQALAALLH